MTNPTEKTRKMPRRKPWTKRDDVALAAFQGMLAGQLLWRPVNMKKPDKTRLGTK